MHRPPASSTRIALTRRRRSVTASARQGTHRHVPLSPRWTNSTSPCTPQMPCFRAYIDANTSSHLGRILNRRVRAATALPWRAMVRWGIAAVAAVLVLGSGAGVAQAAPTWSVDDAVVAEGDSGTTQLTFTITADGMDPLLSSASVDYTTVNGTATAPGDYAAKTA